MSHYVCDRCGHYWHAQACSACPECDAERVWEFPPASGQHARDHAARICAVNASGLFRAVQR